MLQAPHLFATATVRVQVPTHTSKMIPGTDMTRSETSNQVNKSPRSPNTTEPGARAFKTHPSEVRRTRTTVPGRGPDSATPRQEVILQVNQQIPSREGRANGKKSPAADLAIQSAVSLPQIPEWAGIQAKRTAKPRPEARHKSLAIK